MASNENQQSVEADAFTFWNHLKEVSSSGVEEFCAATGLDQSKVMAIATEAEEQRLVEIGVNERQEVVPVPEATQAVKDGLPERKALTLIGAEGGPLPMPEFVELMKKEGLAINEVIRWGKARGWLDRGKEGVTLSDVGKQIATDGSLDADEQVLASAGDQRIFLDEVENPERVEQLLKNRTELARLHKRSQRTVSLTDAGREFLQTELVVRDERNMLTPEDIRSGAWRNITLRAYDVTLESQTVRTAKIHPLRKIIEQTRRTFLEMGFTETVSPLVESAFWNFDALFQPQDHPAREMQDTFYMAKPATASLPSDAALVGRVKQVHEDGGDTGSEGWGYQWSEERASQSVLRTHTTAATIRALAADPNPPVKVFCVGWTFRNETISYKHLPVFHQVDGIILDENASLASLLQTLGTFYNKMGFDRVKFKPAFYPYTEPSVDVVVYHEPSGKWIEMGGSGIFRPEVTEPLGCKHPVLAWGLGVERLAMIRYGCTDIRELYSADVDDIRGVPLCR